MTHEELPEGWYTFTTALPPNFYTKLKARAEGEGVDVLTEAAYLLAYGLDNAPRPSETTLSAPERAAALQLRMRIAALSIGAKQREKTGPEAPGEGL